MRIFKAISVLLTYPSGELISALPEVRRMIQSEEKLPASVRHRLACLVDDLERETLLDLQERYVQLFDQTPSLCLFLFDHNFGDDRERGEAMVELRQLYARQGLKPTKTELPDFLPMICEFLSIAEPSVGSPLLADTLPILEKLEMGLAKRDSAYSSLLEALCVLADVESTRNADAQFRKPTTPKEAVDERSMDAIDEDWEERPVTFGFDAPETLLSPESLLKPKGPNQNTNPNPEPKQEDS
jgi:nitrate reductase molybdenum cofactor assembly chaperone NarJ/NarW